MTAIENEEQNQPVQREFDDPIQAIKFYMDARGLTQRDLVPLIGNRSKVSEVLAGTRGLTMPMARALHRHLGIPADVLLKEPVVQTGECNIELDWRQFPLRQMAKRGWIENRSNLQENAKELVTELMQRAGHTQVASALFRKNDQNRANAKTDPYALNAWCWRVLAQANEKTLPQRYRRPDNTMGLMNQVARLSPATDGPLRAVEFLAEHGIAVEILRHLPRTHLDGAAMKSAAGFPVIGLTLRYDRIDHFWYTLLHEISHAIDHLDDNRNSFFDDFGIESVDNKEQDADEKASESLIPRDDWLASGISQNPSPMAVMALAHEVGVHPAIVAGRARHERQNYRLLTQFVGTRTVRALFHV